MQHSSQPTVIKAFLCLNELGQEYELQLVHLSTVAGRIRATAPPNCVGVVLQDGRTIKVKGKGGPRKD